MPTNPKALSNWGKGLQSKPNPPAVADADMPPEQDAPGGGDEPGAGYSPPDPDQRWTPEEQQRLQLAGYLEVRPKAGPISCGGCLYFQEGGQCSHPDVDAEVVGDHGVCEHFDPSDPADLVYPGNTSPADPQDGGEGDDIPGDDDYPMPG